MPHIAILEPYATGHRIDFVRYALAGLRALPEIRVTLLVCGFSMDHPNFKALARDFADMVGVEALELDYAAERRFAVLGRFAQEQAAVATGCARALRRLAARRPVDFVLLTMLENVGFLQLPLRPHLFGGLPWAAVCSAPTFHIPAPDEGLRARLRDMFHRTSLRALLRRRDLARMFTITPFLAEAVGHPKLAYVRNPSHDWPAESREAARRHYGVGGDATVVLAFGSIDRRKEIAILLEGAAQVPDDVAITVLVAGPQLGDDVAATFASEAAGSLRRRGRLVVMDRDIRAIADPNPCVAADIVWVRYHRSFRHLSGVMVKAGQARRPVIARPVGTVGRYIAEHGVGLAVDDDDPQAIAGAIVRLARDPELRRTLGEAGFRTFAGHTAEAFGRAICDVIAAHCTPGQLGSIDKGARATQR